MSDFGTFLGFLWFLGAPEKKKVSVSWVWWQMLAILALERERQEVQKFKVILSFVVTSG